MYAKLVNLEKANSKVNLKGPKFLLCGRQIFKQCFKFYSGNCDVNSSIRELFLEKFRSVSGQFNVTMVVGCFYGCMQMSPLFSCF